MSFSRRPIPTRASAARWMLYAATMLFVAVGMLFTERAEASCGDYVVIGPGAGETLAPMAGHRVGSPNHPDMLDGFLPGAMPAHGAAPTPVRPPCEGANCERRVPQPPLPTPPAPVERMDRWACAVEATVVELSPIDIAQLAERASASRGFPQAIERPPRLLPLI